MLTAELVKVRRKKGVIELVPRGGRTVEETALLVAPFIDAARALEGASRAELVEALDEAATGVDDARLGRALKKLVLDACDFGDDDVDSATLRAEVFGRAAEARRAGTFDRAAVLAETGALHALTADGIEQRLYADLKDAQRVRAALVPDPDALATEMLGRELQALLLRAEQARFFVDGAPADVRRVLSALKLQQLLFTAEPADSGVTLVVEGPMALFSQTTRYGLKMALIVPHVLACAGARIDARLRLRKHGVAEPFSYVHDQAAVATKAPTAAAPGPALSEAAAALCTGIEKLGGAWRASAATELLAVPGIGALVPDLVVEHADTGERLYVEILGFWSRDAVWRRVQLVEQGLPFRVVFCVSERLRVSEAALSPEMSSSLLVYKGVIPTARLVERLDALAGGARVPRP